MLDLKVQGFSPAGESDAALDLKGSGLSRSVTAAE